jgi:hypothetical protein
VTSDDAGSPPSAARLVAAGISRAATGERLAGFIYGTLVVLAFVIAAARAYPDGSGRIAAFVALTSVVLWLAHVYAHAVGHSVSRKEHLALAELRLIARREASIVEAAVPAVAALLLGAFGVVSTEVAVWMALGLGLLVLAAQGIMFARLEQLGWVGTLVVVAANVGLGGLLIAMKLLLTH